ncbi:unnamed protein product [Dovyalis caffra]|uniref:Uncharacterized protein n=1 Tax=Dovyalis caffra TaxID=77055 RepID=A0AAV1R6F3_9ROSI|nr:unnamed protein product [Dovyalis caffra]
MPQSKTISSAIAIHGTEDFSDLVCIKSVPELKTPDLSGATKLFEGKECKDVTSWTTMMDLSGATKLFEGKECKDVTSWTTMMGCKQSSGSPREASNLLTKERREENYSLDAVILVSAITASDELAALEFCSSNIKVFELNSRGLELEQVVLLSNLYASAERFQCGIAEDLRLSMQSNGSIQNPVRRVETGSSRVKPEDLPKRTWAEQ